MGPDLLRHLALSLFGASAARALIFLMLPLAARLYTKEDFGGLALVLGFAGLIQPLLTLRYEIAIVLPRSDAVARTIARGLFSIALTGYCIVALLIAVLPQLLSRFADPAVIATLRFPVLVHLAATVALVALTGWLQRKSQFSIVALSQFLGALTTAIVVLGAPSVIEPNLVILFSGYAAGAAVSMATALYGVWKSSFFSTRTRSKARRTFSVMRKYRVYPIYSLPLTLSSLVADRMLLIYISGAFSLAALGAFFSVRQLLLGLVHLVTASVSQVIYAYAAQSGQRIAALGKPIITLAAGIAVTAGLCLGWVYANATELTRILLGTEWIDSARIVPWIALQGAAVAVSGWQSRLLDVERRQSLDAGLQVGGDIALIMVIGLLWFIDVPETAAVATLCSVTALQAMVWLMIVHRVTGLGARRAASLFGALFLAATVTAAASIAARVAFGEIRGAIGSFAFTSAVVIAVMFVAARTLNRHVKTPAAVGEPA